MSNAELYRRYLDSLAPPPPRPRAVACRAARYDGVICQALTTAFLFDRPGVRAPVCDACQVRRQHTRARIAAGG